MRHTLETIIMLAATLAIVVAAASGAEPKATATVSTTGDLTTIDARASVGRLVWKVNGDHSILFGGTVVVVRGDFVAALVAVAPDGTVDVILLPAGADPPPDPAPEKTLARLCVEWSALVKSDERATEAKILAGAFRATAARIAAGTLKTPEEIIEAQATANEAALGERLNDWTPWRRKLADHLNPRFEAGEFAKVKDFVPVWLEIAGGLDGVK